MSVKDTEHLPRVLESRLETSKNFLKFFLEKVENPVAIATFSQDMTLELPFSTDSELIKNVISGISLQNYGGGSDFLQAIHRLENLYKNRSNTHILVLSDMEFFKKNTQKREIPKNFTFHFIGVGTQEGGFMLEAYAIDGTPLYKQFQGKNAISSLDEKNLQKLSGEFGAESFILKNSQQNEEIFWKIFPKIQTSREEIDFYFIFGVIFLFYWIILNAYILKKYDYKA